MGKMKETDLWKTYVKMDTKILFKETGCITDCVHLASNRNRLQGSYEQANKLCGSRKRLS
jgi:hypothetical protein